MKHIPIRKITPASLPAVQSGVFTIRKVEDILQGKDLMHPLHKHDFYFILALQHGRGFHDIDFTSYPLQDRHVFLLRPGQVHQLHFNKKCTGFLVEFDAAFFQSGETARDQRWRKSFMINHWSCNKPVFEKMSSWLTACFEEFVHKQYGFADAIRANLDLFILEYARLTGAFQHAKQINGLYQQSSFDALTELLEKNVGRMKTVAEYADALHLSAYQLNSITKSAVGKTVSQLIDDQLILDAKRNLLATGSQVKDIADQLGFDDVSYFTRFFKKHTGHSPEEFRHQLR